MSHFGRKAAIAAVAFATVGSTLFGGAALADDNGDDRKHDDKKVSSWKAGDGGEAKAKGGECKNVSIIDVKLALLKELEAGDQNCYANGNADASGGGFDY